MGCDNPGWSYWVHPNWKPAKITIRSSFTRRSSLCFDIDKLFTFGTCNLVECVSRYSGKRLCKQRQFVFNAHSSVRITSAKTLLKIWNVKKQKPQQSPKINNAPVPKMHTEPKLDYYQNAAVGIQLHIYSVIPRVGNSITTYNNKSSTFPRMLACKCRSIIIIMYIYHALINALSAHMIHINLNTIFYTHVQHSPTKTI